MAASAISVVIPAYKAEATLRRAIDSCLSDIAPVHIIVVLDGPDAALERLARGAADGIQVVVLPAQRGAPVCRNVGLCLVNTRYVMFLDADDYIEGGFLRFASAAADRLRADLVLGRFSFEMPDGVRTPVDTSRRYEDFSRAAVMKRWLAGDYTPPCAVVWRSEFVREIGGWDPSLAKNQDGDLIYRALLSDPAIAACAGGQGIYVQADNPHRISLRNTMRTLESQLAVLEKVRVRLGELPFDPAPELALAYYSLARLAFSGNFDEFGARAEATARELGLAGQPGSSSHNLVASVIGLRGKQRLATLVRRAIVG